MLLRVVGLRQLPSLACCAALLRRRGTQADCYLAWEASEWDVSAAKQVAKQASLLDAAENCDCLQLQATGLSCFTASTCTPGFAVCTVVCDKSLCTALQYTL